MKKKKMRERWITFLCRNWESYAQNVRELQIYSKMMRIRRMKIDSSEDMKM